MTNRTNRMLSRFLGTLVAGAALMTGLAEPLSAQVPATISYQGEIQGASGPVDLVFRLYTSAVGGTVLWSEQHKGVPITSSGTFSVTLGSTTSMESLTFDRPYYLEIVINGNVLAPRTQMTASPYARRAAIAGSLANGALRPEAIAAGGTLPADGEVLAYDASGGQFRWRALGSGGGGAIEQLVEGDGIRIEDLLGPAPTIHIRQNGIVGSMIADTTMTDRVIKSRSITARVIADGTLTQEKFADGVGLPNIGTAGGDLIGNYPNPTIRDSGVRTNALATGAVTSPKIAPDAIISDLIKDGTIIGADLSTVTVLNVRGVEASGYLQSPVVNAIGAKNVGQTRVMRVQGSSSTSATTALEVVDSGGAPLLRVRDDRTVGIGTTAPTAGLEIQKPGGAGLKVTSGSTSFSYGSVNAGASITLPNGTTIVKVADDGAAAANVVTFGTSAGPGELVIIINSDADSLSVPGNGPLAPGATGMYVGVAGGGYLRIN